MGKRVWVLGAGFSRPLGGPLLDDLLRPNAVEVLRAAFPGDEYAQLDDAAHRSVPNIYAHGRGYLTGPNEHKGSKVGELLWADAEEFLDVLDSAALGDASAARTIARVFSSSGFAWEPLPKDLELARRLTAAAKRLVAGECSRFTANASPGSLTERWEPYHYWASQLSPDDTIISFNYDLVLEIVAQTRRAAGRIHVVVPGQTNRSPTAARVLKLHGSVDWRKNFDGQRTQFVPQGDAYSLRGGDEEIAIFSPGPSKASSQHDLIPLWTEADLALREADAITFVGYRFPPSDANARGFFLDALKNNTATSVSVGFVLGPNTGHDDVRRVRMMTEFILKSAGRRFDESAFKKPRSRKATVNAFPLWSQDFFSMPVFDLVDAPRRFGYVGQ